MFLRRQDYKIAVVGGDERQIYAAKIMAEMGYEVSVFGFDMYNGSIGLCTRGATLSDTVKKSCAVILPIPASRDGVTVNMPLSEHRLDVKDLISHTEADTLILGGMIESEDVYSVRRSIDYSLREDFKIANAYLTAESAVGIAVKERKASLSEDGVLVVGYGRIGKCLCHLLKGMGANVYASARKKGDFEWIRAFGYSSVDTSKICSVVSDCKIVFNTVPGLVIGKEILCCMPKDCLVIDLASKPGGVDFEAASECGLRTIWALGLPGKELPESAGRVVARTVLGILEDEGVI